MCIYMYTPDQQYIMLQLGLLLPVVSQRTDTRRHNQEFFWNLNNAVERTCMSMSCARARKVQHVCLCVHESSCTPTCLSAHISAWLPIRPATLLACLLASYLACLPVVQLPWLRAYTPAASLAWPSIHLHCLHAWPPSDLACVTVLSYTLPVCMSDRYVTFYSYLSDSDYVKINNCDRNSTLRAPQQ